MTRPRGLLLVLAVTCGAWWLLSRAPDFGVLDARCHGDRTWWVRLDASDTRHITNNHKENQE